MNKKNSQKLFTIFFCLFIFFLPWQTRFIYKDVLLDAQIWQYGRLSLYFSLIFLLSAVLFFAQQHHEQWALSRNKWWYILFLYSLLLVFIHPWPILGLYYLFVIVVSFLFIFLAQYVQKKHILWALVCSGLGQGILAIYQSISQYIPASKWFGLSEQLAKNSGVSVLEFADMRILRAYGLFPHPNILGGFLVLAILAGLYLWQEIYKRSDKFNWQINKIKKYCLSLAFLVLSLVLMSFGLLASFSRSALLALFLVLLFIFIFSLIKKEQLTTLIFVKYAVLFLVVLVVFNLYYPGLWASRFDFANRLENKSIQERQLSYGQLNWGKSSEVIFGHGLGLNTYWAYHKNKPLTVGEVQPIHNWYLLALAEFGLFGVFIFLFLLYLYLKDSFIKNKNNVWFWSFALLLFLLGLFDHYLWTSWSGWLMVGLVVAIIYKKE